MPRRKEAVEMPPIIQAKPVMYTVKNLLHTLNMKQAGGAGSAGAGVAGEIGTAAGVHSIPRTPFTGRRVHFLGIGGSGMSGLAHMLINFGANVSGTDRTPSSVTRRLSEIGAAV